MRILRVAQTLYPEVKGGGAYHVHAMSRDQAAMGHDVTVLTLQSDGSQPHLEEQDGYTVIRYPTTVSGLGNSLSVGIASYLSSVDAFDVIHAHSHLYFSTNLAALRRRFKETPLAITNHGLYSQNAPQQLFRVYLHTIGRLTFNSADVVFCYTDEDLDRLRRLNVSAAVEVVHNGIDTERFTPTGPEHGEVAGEPVVLFVGRLVDGKRPGDALEAFANVREDYPDAVLVFCGDGPLREDLERRAKKLGIASAVDFLGYVSYDEMPTVYRAADVLILPSRAEGLPRTVLEAMASGVPVVVSDLEQVAAVVASEGRTVPVGDINGFTEALMGVIRDDSHDPRSIIEGQYDWQDTVERTTDVLQRL